MPSRITRVGVTAIFVLALAPARQILWASDSPYTVQDVGPAQGVAFGVNGSAVVVGTAGPAPRAAFLAPLGSGPQMLAGLVGSTDDIALGVHPDGWAVGVSTVDYSSRAVRFQSGGALDLAPQAPIAAARAVNDAGAIVGWVLDGGYKAVVWSNGSRMDMAGTLYAQAYAINNAGVVTGSYYAPDNMLRAFVWTPGGSPTALASLGGFTSEGHGINDRGDVVGDSYRSMLSFDEIATLWTAAGQAIDLGTFGGLTSSARDINNRGQIVGYALNGSQAPRAFLSDNGGPLVDLNTLLPPDSGWVLLGANAINDAGQIVGEGTLNGEPRAFLLTPPADADTTPPVIASVTASPGRVWPPRHQMVDVAVGVVATDDSGDPPVCAVVNVVSSEPDNARGDGNTSSDVELTGPERVRVRAERSGPSGARVYTITVQCTDASGNAAAGAGTVTIGEAVALKANGKK